MKIDEMFNKYPTNIIGFRVNGAFKMLDFWLDPKCQNHDKSASLFAHQYMRFLYPRPQCFSDQCSLYPYLPCENSTFKFST